jgi:Kef-type K+ transport system membrane component KefB
MHKSTAATGIMTAAVIDDVLSLIGVAIIVPMVISSGQSSEGVDFILIGVILLKVIIFFAIILFFGLIAFPERAPEKHIENETFLQKSTIGVQKFLNFLGIRKLITLYDGEFTPLIMVFIAMLMGYIAHEFGFHPAIGAYLAGLFLKQEYFAFSDKPETEKGSHYKRSKYVIDHLAFTIFGPIFFVNLGSKIILEVDVLVNVLPITLTLFTLVFTFQILSAAMAARWTGNYAWHESVMIGFGMLGRAELAFIVINIAYVQNEIITTEQFYALVFTTFLLNISVPITIKFWKPYYNGEKELSIFGVKISK